MTLQMAALISKLPVGINHMVFRASSKYIKDLLFSNNYTAESFPNIIFNETHSNKSNINKAETYWPNRHDIKILNKQDSRGQYVTRWIDFLLFLVILCKCKTIFRLKIWYFLSPF